jgi:SAM-dependent methyltransferase
MTLVAAPSPGLLDRLDLMLLRLAKKTRMRYDGDSTFYDAFFGERDLEKYVRDVRNRWRFALVDDVLRYRFRDRKPDVLDVGCGLGVARRFLSVPRTYIGIDVSATTVELARRLHPEARVDFHVGSLPNLPLPSASVDAAICLEVLEHLENDESALRELRRVMRPGGFLIVSVPQTFYWPAYRELIGHFRHYTPKSLRRLLQQEGFEFVEGLPQFRRIWRTYHYAYVAALGSEALARRVIRRDVTLYDNRAYERVARALLRILKARRKATSGSTFVLARRPEEA